MRPTQIADTLFGMAQSRIATTKNAPRTNYPPT